MMPAQVIRRSSDLLAAILAIFGLMTIQRHNEIIDMLDEEEKNGRRPHA